MIFSLVTLGFPPLRVAVRILFSLSCSIYLIRMYSQYF